MIKVHCIDCWHEIHKYLCPATNCDCYMEVKTSMIKWIKKQLKKYTDWIFKDFYK